MPPQPQTQIPENDHVLRYIGRKHVDNGVVNGSGFMRRPTESTPPSVNWMECFLLPIDNQVAEIAARKRLNYERRAKLVRINVGQTKRYVEREAPMPVNLRFLHDPLPAEGKWRQDCSHAVIDGIPVQDTPEAEMVQDFFVDCILDQFDVAPD